MVHRFGMSGSTILSNPDLFDQLFTDETSHIEMGEFPDEQAFYQFLKLLKQSPRTFGLHSPLYRHDSKYDLLENVQHEPESAWQQFEKEVERMASLNADYILVHFPYFKAKREQVPLAEIENGLKRLCELQHTYQIPIVCEPKLGANRSPAGIDYLHQFPRHIWEKYGLYLCIDLGDYQLAAQDNMLAYIQKWRGFIKVVHLHHVEWHNGNYYWVPLHPSGEGEGMQPLKNIIAYLGKLEDVYFIFEHTPHTNPSDGFVKEGVRWVKDVIKGE
ncbi:TIM barrel protein [Thalassobacillus sp. CUG 92003]|uniref:TIM barrel protein n=1 Tax=Thalassobacillus sp. CUG 92003 TaxID=2736641 RepID=UPI0015E6497A|nr:TIM barrel protein [Thalassobacillus sp. CUG 92003]